MHCQSGRSAASCWLVKMEFQKNDEANVLMKRALDISKAVAGDDSVEWD